MAPRWTIDRASALFEERGCKLLETTYVNSSTQMRYIAKCGHERTSTLENFRMGKGDLCPTCRRLDNGRKKALNAFDIIAAFEEEGCKVLTPASDIKRVTQKIRYIAQCGHENEMDYHHFVGQSSGRVCAKCSKAVLYKYDYVKEAFENRGCILLESEYVNCKTPMRYIATCGHEDCISFDVFLNCKNASLKCPNCRLQRHTDGPVEDRQRYLMKKTVKETYARDNWTCLACGHHGGELNAHHLEAYIDRPDLRFDPSNLVTLCPSCHTKFHRKCGYGGNTKDQFYDWLREYRGNSFSNANENCNA